MLNGKKKISFSAQIGHYVPHSVSFVANWKITFLRSETWALKNMSKDYCHLVVKFWTKKLTYLLQLTSGSSSQNSLVRVIAFDPLLRNSDRACLARDLAEASSILSSFLKWAFIFLKILFLLLISVALELRKTNFMGFHLQNISQKSNLYFMTIHKLALPCLALRLD